jgi:hypothetical protein
MPAVGVGVGAAVGDGAAVGVAGAVVGGAGDGVGADVMTGVADGLAGVDEAGGAVPQPATTTAASSAESVLI